MIGVDGCRGGWCAALVRGPRLEFAVAERLVDALARLEALVPPARRARVLVDVPIGLPQGRATRACDDLARRALGPRRASVFPAPPRVVLAADDHAAANALARRATGRGLSVQSFHLLPRVREVDALVRADPGLAARLFESHPELVLARLSGAPMSAPKRDPLGREERLALLERAVPDVRAAVAAVCAAHPRRVLAPDDAVDAAALAVAAALPARALETLPADPPRDGAGLAMAITVPRGPLLAPLRRAR